MWDKAARWNVLRLLTVAGYVRRVFLLLVVMHTTVGGQHQRTIAYTSRVSAVWVRPECVNL